MMSKRLLLALSATILFSIAMVGQAKKPTIMVVPADIWCIKNNFTVSFTDEGGVKKIADYKAALQTNSDIRLLISKMSDIMASRGFPLKMLEQELKKIESESVTTSLIQGSNTGAVIAESPIDLLNRQAKADIILDLAFEIKKSGPTRQVSFNVQALDAYTSKLISGNTGVSTPSSSAPLEILLEEVVLSFMDKFTSDLQRHFDDVFANGREIRVSLRKFGSWSDNFETEYEYNGQQAELADIVGVWFEENSVQGRFSQESKSANIVKFEQVRMPLFGKSLSGKEVAIDANGFVRSLVAQMIKPPYNVPSIKIMPKGLGEVWLIFGDK